MIDRPGRTLTVVLSVVLGLGALVAGACGDDDDNNASAAPAPIAAESESRGKASGADTFAEASGGKGRGSLDTGRLDQTAETSAPGPAAAAAPAGATPAADAAAPAVPDIGPETAALGGTPVPSVSPLAVGPSRIIKTADLRLEVAKGKVAEIQNRAIALAAENGGYTHSANLADQRADTVLKVPADRLEPVLDGLAALGKKQSQSVSGEDVSAEFVDLEARLRHWRAQEAVFLDLMTRAKSIPDTIQIQQQLSQIQAQVEQIEGRRRFLDGQTAYSTIHLGLVESGTAAPVPEPEQSTLAAAWEDSTGVALDVLGGAIVVLGAVLPLAMLLGVPALIWFIRRRRQGRATAGVATA